MKVRKGFTLIELLIVIAIIAILAAVVFVALDPLTRFQDARNARRWSDADAIVSAIKLDQVDNGGNYHANITALTNTETYMIYEGTAKADVTSPTCASGAPDSATHAVDLEFLVTEGYLSQVPVSPDGAQTGWGSDITGYTLTKTGNNITITACETEGGTVQIRR